MGFFARKSDPIAEHEKALKAELGQVRSQIARLNSNIEQTRNQPHVRSTVFPHAPAAHHPEPHSTTTADPVFERVDIQRITSPPGEAENTPAHYNESGIRKFDPFATWQRIAQFFKGSPPANSQLINYLAAGSIHGLRPLRYEKRVARRRVFALFLFLVGVLWGIIALYYRYH